MTMTMARFRILVSTALLLVPAAAVAEQNCGKVSVVTSAEVTGRKLVLADLLAPGVCPELRQAASAVELGSAPLPGSVRVLEGGEVRRLLVETLGALGNGEIEINESEIPQRILVRHAGLTKSCDEIWETVAQQLRAHSSAAAEFAIPAALVEDPRPRAVDCGAANRVPHGARLELSKIFWDPALRSWEFSLHCADSRDCIPFLVRLRASSPARLIAQVPNRAAIAVATSRSATPRQAIAPHTGSELLVRPGQTVTLRWEQEGIRLVLPVTCLDRGALGESVRVRIRSSNRVLRAEVIGPGELRSAL